MKQELKAEMKQMIASFMEQSGKTALVNGIFIGLNMMIAVVESQLPLNGNKVTLNFGGYSFDLHEARGNVFEVIGKVQTAHL